MNKPADNPVPKSRLVEEVAADQRRGFLVYSSALVIGGLITIFPFLAGLFVFFDPLRRENRAQQIRVASLDAVPDDGVPRSFPVIVERRDDAWTRYLNEPVGAVYLVRKPGSKEVIAFNATCPHAGCFVSFLADKNYFRCPCHTSAFDLQGRRMLEVSTVPPRDMDSLPCQVRDNQVIVEFTNFVTGTHEKIAKA